MIEHFLSLQGLILDAKCVEWIQSPVSEQSPGVRYGLEIELLVGLLLLFRFREMISAFVQCHRLGIAGNCG